MSKLGAVAHYTQMARDAAAMRAGQHRIEAAGELPGADKINPEEARAEAASQILSYAESVADWLAKACDTDAGRQPLEVAVLDSARIMNGKPALLMAVLMNGDNTQAMRALHRLRELAAAEFKREIDERADELMAESA